MIVLAEEKHMDAAHKLCKNKALLLVALALIVAAPGMARMPAFSLGANTVNLNQSVTSGGVDVASTGTPITFRRDFRPQRQRRERRLAGANWVRDPAGTLIRRPTTSEYKSTTLQECGGYVYRYGHADGVRAQRGDGIFVYGFLDERVGEGRWRRRRGHLAEHEQPAVSRRSGWHGLRQRHGLTTSSTRDPGDAW